MNFQEIAKSIKHDKKKLKKQINYLSNIPKYMVLDTETNGLISRNNDPSLINSRIIQFCFTIYGYYNDRLSLDSYIIKPKTFDVTNSFIHHITKDYANKIGISLEHVLDIFYERLLTVHYIIAYNAHFDMNIIKSELMRYNRNYIVDELNKKKIIDPMVIGARLNNHKKMTQRFILK